jgi:hypothetical protein
MPKLHDVQICRDGFWHYVSMQGRRVCPCSVCGQDIVGYGWERTKDGWVQSRQHQACFHQQHAGEVPAIHTSCTAFPQPVQNGPSHGRSGPRLYRKR